MRGDHSEPDAMFSNIVKVQAKVERQRRNSFRNE